MKHSAKSVFAVSMSAIWLSLAMGEEISSNVAKDAARGWINLRESLGEAITAEPESVLSYDAKDGKGKYYVVNLQGGGFVVTSGDTELEPILAYSKEGVWNTNAAENPLMVMLNIDVAAMTAELCSANSANAAGAAGGRRLAATSNAQQQGGKAAKWARLRGAASVKGGVRLKGTTQEPVDLRVAPLVTTAWGQSYVNGNLCYNKYTPGNYVCGCVATMGAQLMRYWSWPDAAHKKANVRAYAGKVDADDTDGAWNLSAGWKKAGSGSWTPWAVTPFDTSVPYDWSNMPNTPSANAHYDAIGRLTLDVGLAAGMHYESTGSGAGLCTCARALVEQFAYQNMALRCNPWGTITTEEALNAMLSNFDAGLPCGVTISNPGHAIVGDGYGYDSSKTLYVHFNMGWNGTDTAWYTPPNLKCTHYGYEFTAINGVIYNLYPPTDKNGVSREPGLSIVSGTLLNDSGSPVGGVTVTATNLTTGAAITATSAASTGRFLLWLPAGYYKFSAASGGKNACRYKSIKSVSDNINDEGGQTYPPNGTVGNIHGFELTLDNQIPAVTNIIQDTASFWLDASDASTITTNANGEVTRWNSRVGSNSAGQSTGYNVTLSYPKYEATRFGMPTVDFGDVGSGRDLAFSTVGNIRMAFWVVKMPKSQEAFWLGDYGSNGKWNFHFSRGENGEWTSTHNPTDPTGEKFARFWDGTNEVANMTSECPDDSRFLVVAAEMNEGAYANRITQDRFVDRNGGKQLSELILFDRVLTDEERVAVTEYLQNKWTFEYPAMNDSVFWLDASATDTITTNASGEVTRWNSRFGDNYARPMHDNLASPLYDTTTYGKPTVDFGALGSGKDLGFDAIRNIRTFFMVVKIQKDIGAMWLTCADERHYEFARGEKSKNGAYAADYSKISRMWDGGAQVADIYNEYPSDTQFIVVAGEMSENSTANSITCDRYNYNVNNRNGGKQLCELLVYNRVLSDAERIEVTEYLQAKWPTAATPTSPTATTFYTDSYPVTLECATAGAAIYYTVDGSEPTTNSTLYAGPFTITDTTTVKARAVARGYFDSEVFTQTFTIAPQAATPTSTSTAGYRNTLVDLAAATPGATIRYTTDGSDPTAESPVYDGTINVTNRTGATTVKAVVFADGYRPSEVFTYDYYVKQFFGPTNGANVATWEDTPENRAAHWVHEDEDFKEATGLWSNAVEYVNHKVAIEERNEFTADNPSDARNVIIETTLSFDGAAEEHEDYDGAKAAIRIGTNSCFQVYTTNANGRVWLDAEGASAETNRDYIVRLELDFTNKTYTVAVKNGLEYATLYDGAVTNFPFAYSDGTPYVQTFEFDGEGSVGSIYGSYTNRVVVFVTDEVVTVSDGTTTLTASQAEWLNKRGDHAAVAAVIRTLTSDQFARAYLLNENIMNASYSVDGWGSFEITDIDVGASAVIVKVKLVRNFAVMDGAKAAPINGTLKVYGGANVSGINTQIQDYELNDNDLHFRDGEEATFVIDKGAIKFYKATIE